MSLAYKALIIIQALLGVVMVALILCARSQRRRHGRYWWFSHFVFGKRGAEAGLDRLTWSLVGLFMVICAILGFGFVR